MNRNIFPVKAGIIPAEKSRSDDILLTVDAICGLNERYGLLAKSRTGRYLAVPVVSSLRDFAPCATRLPIRRLKSAVNRIPSLRDCTKTKPYAFNNQK